ncbi:MAG: hypothetical protein JWO08_3344 [Verrucomicrobiaceae bacterium]|nr:hypothetical protein [Verrucomicrobiaceae bacterium]
MSQEDHYYTLPLSHLRNCASPLETLETAVGIGILNTGLGIEHVRGRTAFAKLLNEARLIARSRDRPVNPPAQLDLVDASGTPVDKTRARHLWCAAMVGQEVLGVSGGSLTVHVRDWLKYHRPGEVFFRIRSDWFWQTLLTARRDAGKHQEHIPRPISWREFRLLAGLLSARVNSQDFTFCGWELLQALSCGFHNKEAFERRGVMPDHCQPLSRHMIREGTETLEAVNFYARCRYSRGKAGGLMAYSFRHPKREDLYAAIQQWDAANHVFKAKTAALRATDLQAFTNPPPSVHQASASTFTSPPPTAPPTPAPSTPPSLAPT